MPAQELQTIPITWPFAVWGLDMVGPLQKAPGGYTHLFVAIDKFTKWIEAKPVATITAAKAKEFFQDIVVRFGVPNRIITDNSTQFTGFEFKDWCEELGIKICYASVAHPQSNEQVERANGIMLQGIKSRVFDRLKPYAGKWARELPSVLWALRTSPSRATGESPFFLTYGSEAVLPTELEFGSPRVRNFDETSSEDSRLADLDQLEEARDVAAIRSARYLQGLRCYHDHNVRGREHCGRDSSVGPGGILPTVLQRRPGLLRAGPNPPVDYLQMSFRRSCGPSGIRTPIRLVGPPQNRRLGRREFRQWLV